MFVEVGGAPSRKDGPEEREEDLVRLDAGPMPKAQRRFLPLRGAGPGTETGQMAAGFFLFNVVVLLLLYVLRIEERGQGRFATMNEALNEINNSIVWPGCIVVSGWTARLAAARVNGPRPAGIWRVPVIALFGALLSTLLLDSLLLIFAPVYRLAGVTGSFRAFFTAGFFGELGVSVLCIGLLSLLPLFLYVRVHSNTLVLASSLAAAVLWATQFGLAAAPIWVGCARAAMAAACLPLGLAANSGGKHE